MVIFSFCTQKHRCLFNTMSQDVAELCLLLIRARGPSRAGGAYPGASQEEGLLPYPSIRGGCPPRLGSGSDTGSGSGKHLPRDVGGEPLPGPGRPRGSSRRGRREAWGLDGDGRTPAPPPILGHPLPRAQFGAALGPRGYEVGDLGEGPRLSLGLGLSPRPGLRMGFGSASWRSWKRVAGAGRNDDGKVGGDDQPRAA